MVVRSRAHLCSGDSQQCTALKEHLSLYPGLTLTRGQKAKLYVYLFLRHREMAVVRVGNLEFRFHNRKARK